MSKSFVLRGALGLAALMVATVAIEGQADAFFKHLRRGGGCGAEASCGCAAEVEPSCGCAAEVEEPSCAAPEPSCGCPVVEESCGCPAEPSCGCSSGRRKFKLFSRLRERGCGCESSCGAPADCGCGAPAEEPACGAPADDAVPPAPEAPSAAWMHAKPLVG